MAYINKYESRTELVAKLTVANFNLCRKGGSTRPGVQGQQKLYIPL